MWKQRRGVQLAVLISVSAACADGPSSPYPVYRAFLNAFADSTWATPLVIRTGRVTREFDAGTLDYLKDRLPEGSASLWESTTGVLE